MNSTPGSLADAVAALAGVPGGLGGVGLSRGLGQLSDDEVLRRLEAVEQVGRLVDALRVEVAAEVAERSRYELGEAGLARRHGATSGARLVERVTRVSAGEADRRVRLGQRLADQVSLTREVLPGRFPAVADAFFGGRVGVDAALAITKHLAQVPPGVAPAAVSAAETALVAEALTLSADLVAVEARVWRHALDADGAEPRDERLRRQRRFTIAREIDGMTPFHGLADPTSAAHLRAWLGDRTAPDRTPRFLDDASPNGDFRDESDTDQLDPRAPDPRTPDPRTRGQRDFDVLLGLLQAGVRADAAATGPLHSSANVMVIVTENDLADSHDPARRADPGRRAGTAWLADSAETVPATVAAELACDAGIQPVVLDHHLQPLRLGRRERYFTAAQRKALAVRDGGCVWPACTAPPSWCHAHHIIEWSRGGTTDVDNGVLLCAFHHHLLHHSEYRLRMTRHGPEMLTPRHHDPTPRWQPVGRSPHRMIA